MTLPSDDDHITLLASTTLAQVRGPDYQQVILVVPRIRGYFTGTGGKEARNTYVIHTRLFKLAMASADYKSHTDRCTYAYST